MMAKKNTNNQKGLTFIELTVAMAISLLLVFATYQFLVDQNKAVKNVEKTIDFTVSKLLADKVILRDFRLAYPSINQLLVRDDNNRFFYEYREQNDIQLNSEENKRVIQITPNNASNRFIYVLLHEQLRDNAVYTEPVSFYSAAAGPSPTAGLNLTFEMHLLKKYISDRNPKILEENSLIFFDSSITMPITANNPLNRTASVIATTNSAGNIVPHNLPNNIFNSNIYNKRSTGVVTTTVSDINSFFWNLPPPPTGANPIRIVPVKLIRYSLSCPGVTPPVSNDDMRRINCQLIRSEYLPTSTTSTGAFGNPIMVIEGINSVTFSRDSISSTVTSVGYGKTYNN